jgi:hypothetical protein
MEPLKIFLFWLGSLIICFPDVFSQTISARISLQDWGISDASAIRYGQVSVLREPGGDRLVLYSLYSSFPKELPLTFRSSRPITGGNCFLVSRFESGMRNALGGSFNVFQRFPSSASVAYRRGSDARRALRLMYSKSERGFCGLWIHLFNSTSLPEERVYFDATDFAFLTFWVRSSSNAAQLSVKIADASLERNEDAVAVGDLGSFAQSGRLDTAWQHVVIPLTRIPNRILKNQLATLSLEVNSGPRGWIDISSLAFCRTQADVLPLPPPSGETAAQKFEKGLWVWNTEKIFQDLQHKESLLELIRRDKIKHVFLAIPYRPFARADSLGILIDVPRMRALLSDFHSVGVKVHALLGDKDFILPNRRPFVRATLENIVKYNGAVKPEERFYAIHLDVEPYLRPGFGGVLRSSILEQFLDLLAESAAIAKSGGISIGADIPFWLDSPDEFNQTKPLLSFRGATKLVSEHVIDILDFVVLMSYRTFAAGADGIVLHSYHELEYASQTGKQVFVGLETGPLPDENILTFRGMPSPGIPQATAGRFAFCVGKGDTVEVVVARGDEMQSLENFLRSRGLHSTQCIWWPIVQDIFVPQTKITFSDLPRRDLSDVVEQVTAELSSYSAFQGIALHHSESYLRLLRRP